MSQNPYQPPADLPTLEDPGLWTMIVRAMHRLWYGPYRDTQSVRFILSGRAFFEYGVVFRALPKDTDHFFAKMPLMVDDEMHRQRNITEAARVLRELCARVNGLEEQLGSRNLVLSMVPSYNELGTELCRVVIPPETWRQGDARDTVED